MVPLQHTSRVILTTNGQFHISEEIFRSSLRFQSYDTYQLSTNDLEPAVLANSCYKPAFAGTLQAARSRLYAQAGKESLYLLRADGVVISLDIKGTSSRVPPNYRAVGRVETTSAAGFAYPMFTNNLSDIEALIISGYAGDCEMVCMGDVPSRELDRRRDFMEMRALQTFPNWAPTVDMVVANRGDDSNASVFVTSGLQPLGCVAEIRMGLEAKITGTLSLREEIRVATGLWVVNHLPEAGSTRILVSSESATIVINPNKAMVTGSFNQRTFLIVEEGDAVLQIMQTKAVLLPLRSTGLPQEELGFGACAAIFATSVSRNAAALVVQRSSSGHCLSLVQRVQGSFQVRTAALAQRIAPTSAAVFDDPSRNAEYMSKHSNSGREFIAILGTDHGLLLFYTITLGLDEGSVREHIAPLASREPIQLSTSNAIDSIAISGGYKLGDAPIVVCGTRGGTLIHFPLHISRANDQSLQIRQGPSTEISVGRDPVSLTADTRHRGNYIFASSGKSILRISRDVNDEPFLSMDSIWFTNGSKTNLRPPHSLVVGVKHSDKQGQFFTHELCAFAEGILMTVHIDGIRGAVHRRIPLPWWTEQMEVKSKDKESEQPTPTTILQVRGTKDLAVGAKRAKPQGSRRGIYGLVYFMSPDAATNLDGTPHISQRAACVPLVIGEEVRCMCNWSPGLGYGLFVVVGTSHGLVFLMLAVKGGRVSKVKVTDQKYKRNGVTCVAEMPDGALAVCDEAYLDVYQSEILDGGT